MLFLLTILICLNSSLQDCVIDNRTPENAWEQKLHTDIVAKSEINDIPCKNSRGVEIQVKFALKYFNFDSNEGLFSFYSWIFLNWDHDKMTWNPADYGGLNETFVSNMHFWYPKLMFYSGLATDETEHYFMEPCEVSSYGHITCVYRFVDRAICIADLTTWPYDSQTCSLKFGVKPSQNRTVRLKVSERAVRMIGADYGAEWDIIDYKQEEDQGAKVQLKMTFVIERHAESLAALLVYPSIVLSALSISSFALDVRKTVRLYLLVFNLGNHFYYLKELEEDIPNHSARPPLILMFYRGSMITNLFLLLLTYALSTLCKRDKVPQFWISKINDLVFKGRGNMLVWPKWNADVSTNEFAEQWTNFANLINNILFVVIIIVYVCLYGEYMPRPLPLNY